MPSGASTPVPSPASLSTRIRRAPGATSARRARQAPARSPARHATTTAATLTERESTATQSRLTPGHPRGATYDALVAPRISVLVPCYDDGATVAETVASIVEDEVVEVVLIDDGSRDPHTIAVLDDLAASGQVRLIRQANAGVAAALRAGHGRRHDALRLHPQQRRPRRAGRPGRAGRRARRRSGRRLRLRLDPLLRRCRLRRAPARLEPVDPPAFQSLGDLDASTGATRWTRWAVCPKARPTRTGTCCSGSPSRIAAACSCRAWCCTTASTAPRGATAALRRDLRRQYATLRARHAPLFAREPELRRRWPIPLRTRLAYRAQLRAGLLLPPGVVPRLLALKLRSRQALGR